MSQVIIDVREKDEFDAEHIENSIHIPLSEFNKRAPAVLNSLQDRQIVLMCLGGKRATLAALQAKGISPTAQIEVFHGGIQEWKKQGRPTVATKKAHFPIIRQVQLIAGSLVLLGSLLAYFKDPAFILIAAFVGTGLTIAGVTGFCGMAEVLARMPWNKSHPGAQKELCSVSPKSCDPS